MHLKNFSYHLPEELIAQQPLPRRDQARLMVVCRSTGKISHDHFFNVGKYLPPQSCLVLNNSKVIPARLIGEKLRNGGKVEIFLLRKLAGDLYEVLMKPTRRIKEGEEISFNGNGLIATVVDKEKKLVQFNCKDLGKKLNRVGHMPLPPYIRREDGAHDRELYQTVYARRSGSVAAPTAGLHFTKPLLENLKKIHDVVAVTLHINYATFKPVEEEDITQHQMHYETYSMSREVAKKLQLACQKGQKIVAVGTTSCRVLEAVAQNGKLRGETNIFIYPGYQFQMTDILITNFHLPYSSLLMLVYAFGGMELMKRAYQEAIKEKYRFYSYGDAMVII
ncbi:MAG: tRNA preQ1(34) S-adenosylmethionine ribosyltransferase-isomerase QueA [Candidatus Omnitrophica bacterium]|nr:tRNA preQ1(34) S-adenosylmethionine ribosyltransferase-isomerase QueA [Candidatus Omnitrophota bacterium]